MRACYDLIGRTPECEKTMSNRYLVVSDLHLCDVEEHTDGWKAHKSAAYHWDEDFAQLIERFVTECQDATPTLILNGDTFDFDLVSAVPDLPPWPVSASERRRGLDPTADKSLWKFERLLECHPLFIETLAAYVARGNRLVCIFGNHDRELHFPEVQRAFASAIANAAGERIFDPRLVQFEPWFYLVPNEIYVEHGNQYDHYTSFRHLLDPVLGEHGEDAATLALPMGNLSNRFLMTQMGYFNPHASDYILKPFAYVGHWLRHYAFSRRGIVFKWLFGSVAVLLQLVTIKSKLALARPKLAARRAAIAERFGLTPETLRALERLQEQPITNRFFRILRELWMDRVLFALLMIAGTIALAVVPIPLWIKLMVPLSAFPLLFAIYEALAHGNNIFSVERELPGVARRIALLLSVKVVTFGHTHVPRLVPLGPDSTFVDTGTWAPIMRQVGGGGELAPGYRNYLVAECSQDAARVELRCSNVAPRQDTAVSRV